jgi:stage II sporulation protein M
VQTTPLLIVLIFLRNSLAALLSIALGPFFAVVPVIGAVSNGILIGVIISHVDSTSRLSALLHLLPHGIFELPAIMTAWGFGIWRGLCYFQKNAALTSEEIRKKAYRTYFIFVLPLLIIAAIIEGLLIHIK